MTAEDRIAKALEISRDTGCIDGGHHKMWTIDQMVRALTGCPVVQKTARNYKGQEYTYDAQGESEEYLEFVRTYEDGEDGPKTYEWDTGVAP